MRCRSAVPTCLLALSLLAPFAARGAEEGHEHSDVVPAEKLGTVHFPIAGEPGVQREFDRAVALLHSFQLKGVSGYDWSDQVEVQRRAVQGWIARADRRDGEALDLLRSAADLEDSIDKNPVTPGPLLPVRELLADLLMDQGKPGEAVGEYEMVLKVSPGRRNSLRGLTEARHAVTESGGATTNGAGVE